MDQQSEWERKIRLGSHCSFRPEGVSILRMLNNQVIEQIAQVLRDAGATAHSINEEPSLKIRNIAPYPALFRAEMQRLFGVRLGETDLDMKIDELASWINLNHAARS